MQSDAAHHRRHHDPGHRKKALRSNTRRSRTRSPQRAGVSRVQGSRGSTTHVARQRRHGQGGRMGLWRSPRRRGVVSARQATAEAAAARDSFESGSAVSGPMAAGRFHWQLSSSTGWPRFWVASSPGEGVPLRGRGEGRARLLPLRVARCAQGGQSTG